MNDIGLEVKVDKQAVAKVSFYGRYDKRHISYIYEKIKLLEKIDCSSVTLDCSNIDGFDYAGAVLLSDIVTHFSSKRVSVVVLGLRESYRELLLFARKNFVRGEVEQKSSWFLDTLFNVGNSIHGSIDSFLLFLSFFGESIKAFFMVLVSPGMFRYRATLSQMEKSGVKALPIVALTSFLVGLVIAYQSSEQLSKFGANIFIVDMVNISMFRELAPLIAAIVVAGRSSSSFTAEIGTMKITQEIDAMKSMGFDPFVFLVLTRVFALVLMMPLVVFFADIVGVFGGMIVADSRLGVSFSTFINRTRDVLEIKHVLIGLFKAPFFGMIIALIGCFRGFEVTGSTESIGKYTTISVVNAIFWVIACNALISVLLTEIGI